MISNGSAVHVLHGPYNVGKGAKSGCAEIVIRDSTSIMVSV